MSKGALVFALLLSCVVPACDPGAARASSSPDVGDRAEAVQHTRFGSAVMLFLAHPHPVAGESARFLAHFTLLADGSPVRAGRVKLSLGDLALTADAPKRDGLFVLEGAPTSAGDLPFSIALESDVASETLELGPIAVFATHADVDALPEPEETQGGIAFPLEQQWNVGVLFAVAEPRALSRRMRVPGRVRTPEGAIAEVHAPLAGRISAAEGARWPRSGDRVSAGALLGHVEPPLAAPELAQLEALDTEFDLRALEIEHAVHESQTRLQFIEREHARIVKLHERELATAQELGGAERDLALAQCELEAHETTKRTLDALVAKRAERRGGLHGSRLPIHAPMSGRVASSSAIEGSFAEPADALLRIVDDSRIWIEARVSEFDLPRVRAAAAARATFPAAPGAVLDLRADELALQPGVDAESRTLTLRAEAANAELALSDGMLAELEFALESVAAAVSVPREAVVMEQGRATAYALVSGETFERRELELGVVDGEFVEVVRGLAAGEHVATRGAYVIKLASAAPAAIGHGHDH